MNNTLKNIELFDYDTKDKIVVNVYKTSGNELIANCPKCGDDKGRLYINETKRTYYCQKCSYTGMLYHDKISSKEYYSEKIMTSFNNHGLEYHENYPCLTIDDATGFHEINSQDTHLYLTYRKDKGKCVWFSKKGSKSSWLQNINAGNMYPDTLYIVEGIWDWFNGYQHKLNCVTPSNGMAQKVDDDLISLCKGYQSIKIVFDNEYGAVNNSENLSYNLIKNGVSANIQIVAWDSNWDKGYDLTDYLVAGNKIEDLQFEDYKPSYSLDAEFNKQVLRLKTSLIQPDNIYRMVKFLGIQPVDYEKLMSIIDYLTDVDDKGKEKYVFKAVKIAEILALVHYRYVAEYDEFYKYNGKYYEKVDNISIVTYAVLKCFTETSGFTNNKHATTEVPLALKSICRMKPLPENPSNILCFRDCLFDSDDYRTKSHSPNVIITKIFNYAILPYADNWEEKYEASTFKKFIEKIIPVPEERVFLQEYFGYTFQTDLNLEKALLAIGTGANGKSTLLDTATELFGGIECISGVELCRLRESQFSLAQIYGKVANICCDISARSFDEETFKELVSGDPMPLNQKYKTPKTFRNKAKFFLSCNTLPKISDYTDSVWRRISLINFPVKFVDDLDENNSNSNVEIKDTTMKKKLLDELGIIFFWAMEGLKRIKKNKRFTAVKSINERVVEYKISQNPLLDFFAERLMVTDNDSTSTKLSDLFFAYNTWMDDRHSGKFRINQNKFSYYLLALDNRMIKKRITAGNCITNVFIKTKP